MPKLAASTLFMFREADLLDRFALAASAGFQAVEIQVPYRETPEAIAQRLRDADVQAVLINTPVALAAVPGQEYSITIAGDAIVVDQSTRRPGGEVALGDTVIVFASGGVPQVIVPAPDFSRLPRPGNGLTET